MFLYILLENVFNNHIMVMDGGGYEIYHSISDQSESKDQLVDEKMKQTKPSSTFDNPDATRTSEIQTTPSPNNTICADVNRY
jgi:hypothetical protein